MGLAKREILYSSSQGEKSIEMRKQLFINTCSAARNVLSEANAFPTLFFLAPSNSFFEFFKTILLYATFFFPLDSATAVSWSFKRLDSKVLLKIIIKIFRSRNMCISTSPEIIFVSWPAITDLMTAVFPIGVKFVFFLPRRNARD